MATLTNLAVNPACRNNATGIFGPSGWGRITSAHLTMPRTTAFAGSTPGDMSWTEFPATPGLPYRASVSIRAIAALTGSFNVNWFNGGTYLSTDTVAVSTGASTTVRPEAGGTAPIGATRGVCSLDGIDGSAEVTALLILQTATVGVPYFDGDTPGATWTGTAGNSTSTRSGDSILLGGVSISGVATTTSPGAGTLSVGGVSISGSGYATPVLTATVVYDDLRGRFRVFASGFATAALRIEVHARPITGGRFTLVRGGRVEIVGGIMARPVDDYEYIAGPSMVYRVNVLASPENTPDIVVQTETITVPAPLESAWVKVIAAPYLNRRVRLRPWGSISRPSRVGLFDVSGRTDPIAVSDVAGSRRVVVKVITEGAAEAEELDVTLRSGAPIYLHTPTSIRLPTMYASVGDVERRPLRETSERDEWEIPLTEVAAPPPSVVGSGTTWQYMIDNFATWEDVLATYDTWQDVLA